MSKKISQKGTMKHSGNISNELMAKGWRALKAYNKIHSAVGSTDMKLWHRSLTFDFTEQQFMGAIKLAQDHVGFFDLPAFRELCRASKPDQSHKLFLPEPKQTKLSGDELHKRIAELKESLGMGVKK